MNPSATILFSEIDLAFDGRTVLDSFCLTVGKNETVVLAGPSGCGKSTLLLCLLGFRTPDGGSISVGSTVVTPETVWAVRQQLAYVPQEPDLGAGTVDQWIREMFSLQANRGLDVSREALLEHLKPLGLPATILDQPAEKLSGGEKQRVVLAAALLLKRPILLLDEPTSALDPAARDTVYATIRALRETTVLMVSHDEFPRLDFADRIVQIAPLEAAHGRD